jgi:hypothetical protein
MKYLAGLYLFAVTASAQLVTFGVKGGVRLTEDLVRYSSAVEESKNYVVGPTVVFALPRSFGLEFDARYRRVGFRTGDSFAGVYSFVEGDRGSSWEFPILARRQVWRAAYAGIGYAPRLIQGKAHRTSIGATSLNPPIYVLSDSTGPGQWKEWTHGLVVMTGVERRFGRLRVSPELRFTHWTSPAIQLDGSRGFSIRSTRNQVDVLLGFSF